MSRWPTPALITATLGAVAVVGVIDRVTGPFIPLALLYVPPISIAAWFGGRRAGITVAVAASAMGLVADLTIPAVADHSYPYWNAGFRVLLFLLIVEILVRLEVALEREQEVARREHEAAEKLRELDRLRDSLVQAVVQDIKDPVSGILDSALKLRRDQGQLPTAESEMLIDGVVSLARRLGRQVSEILDSERLKKGLLEVHPLRVDIGQLVHDLLADWSLAGHRSIRLQTHSVIAEVDPTKIQRLVLNLVINAEVHTPEGTAVWVRVEDCDGALISVEDAGPGIPDRDKERIFDRFVTTRPEEVGSMGIGLFLVAEVAEMHGGRAWVEDRAGGGASFRVLLPYSQTRVPSPAQSSLGSSAAPVPVLSPTIP